MDDIQQQQEEDEEEEEDAASPSGRCLNLSIVKESRAFGL